jgi:hypothetical protein
LPSVDGSGSRARVGSGGTASREASRGFRLIALLSNTLELIPND